jgi:hypothetical protein
MTTPRTDAGRALLDRYSKGDPTWFGKAICAIEDEAARMERERIADKVHAAFGEMTCGLSESCHAADEAMVLAAITDTGEADTASEYGRLLAERDRLIASGVDPADLQIPDRPDTGEEAAP